MSNNYIGGQAYTGTRADSPPNIIRVARAPTIYDINFKLGDEWVDTTTEIMWVLVSLKGTPTSKGEVAVWKQFSAFSVITLTGDAGLPVHGDALNDIYIAGGANINTVGDPATHTVTVALNDVVNLPNTNAAGTAGIIQFGGINWINNYGTRNTFVGQDSGNQTLNIAAALYNTGVGYIALQSLTTGYYNVAIGNESLTHVTTGAGNVSVGSGAGITTGDHNVLIGSSTIEAPGFTGSENVCVGQNAGDNLAANEGFNTLIQSAGIVGDNFTTRIADAAPRLATRCFVGGIRGITPTVADSSPVCVNSLGQLGTRSIAFSAYNNASANNVTGDGTVYQCVYTTEFFDNCNNFAANTFTAPIDGKYMFTVSLYLNGFGAAHTLGDYYILAGGVTYHQANNNPLAVSDTTTACGIVLSVVVNLTAGQTAQVFTMVAGGLAAINYYGAGGDPRNMFSGYLITC